MDETRAKVIDRELLEGTCWRLTILLDRSPIIMYAFVSDLSVIQNGWVTLKYKEEPSDPFHGLKGRWDFKSHYAAYLRLAVC